MELTNSNEVAPNIHQVAETSISHQSIRMSPIPSPEELEGYKRVDPNFPERIFKQFEEDSITNRELQKELQAANIELKKRELEADIAFEKRSQYMAFIFVLGFFVGTIILAYLGKDIPSILTGLSGLALLFKGVFSKNPSQKKQDDDPQ